MARPLHVCSVCGKMAEWGKAWCWYGSIEETDLGVKVPKFCCKACALKAKDLGLVPKNAKWPPPAMKEMMV